MYYNFVPLTFNLEHTVRLPIHMLLLHSGDTQT
jgi:hypothetical protein